MSNLNCCFRYSLENSIVPRCISIAKFDGKNLSVVAATKNGKIQIFNPLDNNDTKSKFKYLNINKDITSLGIGPLNPDKKRDMLVVCTESTLHAYDVEDNRDLFFADVIDGIKTMTIGNFKMNEPPLSIVGGNCSILGYNYEGTDVYWSVTGDDVTALAFMDINEDKENELFVASKDYEVKFMKNEEVIMEYTEAKPVITVSPYLQDIFVYGLDNGTIGIYQNYEKKWTKDSKYKSIAIDTYDINLDSIPEIVVGYSQGAVELINPKTGGLLFKDQFPNSISGILQGSFRATKSGELMLCDIDGNIRGYDAIEPTDYRSMNNFENNDMELDLLKKKNELNNHIKALKDTISSYKQGDLKYTSLNPKTVVTMTISIDEETKAVIVLIEATENTVISCVNVGCDDGVLSSISNVFYLDQPSNKISIPLKPIKYQFTTLEIEAIVSPQGYYEQFSVLHNYIDVPKFALFIRHEPTKIDGFVKFSIQERVSRFALWLEEAFLCISLNPQVFDDENYKISLREIEKNIHITFEAQQQGNTCNLSIYCDNMDIVCEVIQSLGVFLSLSDLNPTAYFPKEMDVFKKVIENVENYNNTRQQMSLDVADSTNLLKNNVIKAEDCRLIGDIKTMIYYYNELENLNKEMLINYNQRESNQKELVKALKEVNLMIQKGSNLRLGESKTKFISVCRQAVKENKMKDIIKYIERGVN